MIDGLSIEAVAAKLEMSQGSIYAARSRIIRRIRDEVQQLKNIDDSAKGEAAHE